MCTGVSDVAWNVVTLKLSSYINERAIDMESELNRDIGYVGRG